MKQQINEIRRMQELAGILKEDGKYLAPVGRDWKKDEPYEYRATDVAPGEPYWREFRYKRKRRDDDPMWSIKHQLEKLLKNDTILRYDLVKMKYDDDTATAAVLTTVPVEKWHEVMRSPEGLRQYNPGVKGWES